MRRILDVVQAISLVILAIAPYLPVEPKYRWILIAVAAFGLIVPAAIKETSIKVIREIEVKAIERSETKKRARTIIVWSLVAAAVGIFIVTSAIKESSIDRRVEGLERQIIASSGREEERTRQLEEITDRLFRSVAPEVMEAPKEISPAPAPAPSGEIQIKAPRDGSPAPWRTYVKGTVTDPNANVWVIVHPTDRSAYWVQPSVAVKGDGTWKVQVYLGRAGELDVGKGFEIMAIANPKARLREADSLGGWPEAQWESRVVEVTRE